MSLATELQDVCGRLDRREITRDAFVGACTRLMAQHVGCNRAGIWTFLDAAAGPVQHSLGVFDAGRGAMVPTIDIAAGLDRFVDAMTRDGLVVADDVRHHPATADWWLEALHAQGVESIIAAPFAVNGRLTGVFTCAQVGETMHWTSSQVGVLKRIALRASLSLASATSFTLTTLPAPLIELPPLGGPPDDR